MIIVYNRKRVEFKELFNTVDLFVKYLKENYSSLNFKSKEFNKEIVKAYDFFSKIEDLVQYTRLTRYLNKGFNFSYKNVTKKEFWIERGWSEKETIHILNEDKLKRVNKQIITNKEKNKDKHNLIIDGSINEFRFISGKFFSYEQPICNHCQSNLSLLKVNVNNLDDIFYYKITGCLNDSCQTKDMNKNDKYMSFLPVDISNKLIDEFLEQVKKRSVFSVESWVKKGYTEKEAKIEISNIQSQNSKKVKNRFVVSKENLKKIGKTEEEIMNICTSPTQVNFWIKKGLSKEEAEFKIKTHQEKSSRALSDKRNKNPEKYSSILTSQIGYWLNKGFSEEDAKEKISERQTTFSLDICKQKYGEEEGVKRFNERQNKWNKSLNEGGNLKIGYSKCSQDLFRSLVENYVEEELEDVLFATKGGEFKIQRDEGGIWMYDFVDLRRKKIIEYHGDMYHGNPEKYLSSDTPHPFRKNIIAQEMWDKDKLKLECAQELGFEVFVIWDSEYRWGNKQVIINKCLNFLEINK